jgi:two-component system, NtrC family, response regulator AtoC
VHAGSVCPWKYEDDVNPARLAIVDDDPQFVGYLETLLRSRGYDVQPFTSGSDLLQALHGDAAPDVVLLDVLMPGMDGLDTLRALRVAHPGLQVIMLSGRGAPSIIVDAVRLGAADYVVKPDDPEGLGEAALESAIRNAVEKVVLNGEVARLRAQVGEDPEGLQPYWGPGPAMRHVMNMVERVADSDVSVLIKGESGVGKEVIARELHRQSSRRGRNFVKVNCAALPAELLESELFGHERGAFTGAQAARIGKFEFANHGTIMLDEIGEMSGALQAKLLHVLQDGEFAKLGSNRPVTVDVRVIAATNRDLEQMIRSGSFREDLYYRLQVIELNIPPLRERREEIAQLIEFFLVKYAERYGRPLNRPSEVLRQALMTHSWPGNVRELENVIKRFVILQDEGLVLAELQRARKAEEVRTTAPPAATPVPPPPEPAVAAVGPPVEAVLAGDTRVRDMTALADVGDASPEPPAAASLPELARAAAMRAEREAIQQALDRFRWNRRKAAQALGVSYKTLLNKMKECGIAEPKA